MRKIVLALLAAAAVAFVVVTYFASRGFERRAAAAVEELERKLADSRFMLSVEDIDASWLPRPHVVLEKAKVSGRGKDGLPVLETERVVLYSGTASLFGGADEIDRIAVESPRFFTRPSDESAVGLVGFAHGATVPIELRGGVIRVERAAEVPVIEIRNVDVELVPREGAIEFEGNVSPLGEGSRGDLKGVWRPGAGRTGGDGLDFSLDVSDGDPAALAMYVPELARAKFTHDVALKAEAKGFIGERGTESAPADPLLGKVHAEVGFDLLGLDRRAVFDSGLKLDDTRWVFDGGKGEWADHDFDFAGWIARGFYGNKMNLRMSLVDVAVADVLADYDISDRWRPEAVVSGEIRAGGTFDYPLTRYEVKAPRIALNAWPETPVTAGPTTVRGSLLAINAEVSGSFDMTDLQVGDIRVPNAAFGTRWWRDKFTLTALGLELWGGKFDGSAAYEPAAEKRYKGGGLLRDMDAATVLANVFPNSGLQVAGGLDLSVTTEWRDQGLWFDGRTALHEGKIGPRNLVRQVLEEVAAAVGAVPAVLDELAARHPILVADATPVRRLAADFRSVEDAVAVRVVDLVSEGATVSLDGTLGEDRHLATTGIVIVTPPLTDDLVGRIAPLRKLMDSEGELRVPVRVEGKPAELQPRVEASFLETLRDAREGKDVEPDTTELPEPSYTTDLPPLEEQFGR